MKCYDVIDKLSILSPLHFAQTWDNVGLLVGRKDREIEKVFIALDATDAAIEACIFSGAQMLLTHHPLIFSPLKHLTTDDFIGRRIYRLIEHDICYYAMHTNFDIMGMADCAADELKLRNRDVLQITYEDDISKEGFGRIGRLPGMMSLAECAEYVKRVFQIPNVKIFGDLESVVETAAILPGSGKSAIDEAIYKGADVLITGDVDHHSGIDAVAKGLAIIDAGHYGVEKIFLPYMKEYFHRELKGLDVALEEPAEPFCVR